MTPKVFIGLASALFALVVSGQSIAIEEFDAVPQTLHNYAGGSGWFAPWSSQNTVSTVGYRILDTNPMVHPEFPNPGSYVQGGLANTTSGRYFSDVAFIDFQDAEDRIGVGVLYFSFLVRKLQDNDFPIEIVLADTPGQPWGVNEELISIGYFGASSNSGGNRYWSVAAFNETAIDLSDTIITIGETYQIVVEIDFEAATTINMWVNPTDGIPDLSTPDASVSSIENLGFWNMVLRFGQAGADHGSFDEFIFSDNLATVLPVTYLDFQCVISSDKTVINWSTATELNNDHFKVLRSADGSQWETVGIVEGSGNSNEVKNYTFTDARPDHSRPFYRLGQVDFDGQINFSPTIKAEYSLAKKLDVAISTAEKTITLFASREIKEVLIFNITGQLILHQKPRSPSFSFSSDVVQGALYHVLVKTDSGIWQQKMLVY